MNTSIIPNQAYSSRQSGAALVIGLVLLITLTILGVGVLTTTSLEQRMAGNMSDVNIAFNAAETAARELTSTTVDIPGEMEAVCQRLNLPTCVVSNLQDNWWEVASDADWAASGVNIPGLNVPRVSTQPQVVIELLKKQREPRVGHDYQRPFVDFISLTTRARGASRNTEVIIQQTIVKR